jgi:hypothetical protein
MGASPQEEEFMSVIKVIAAAATLLVSELRRSAHDQFRI